MSITIPTPKVGELGIAMNNSKHGGNVNLSLETSTGTSVNRSESFSNNVEIMEYVPDSAGVYTIIVDKFSSYIYSNIYYCVAWTCTD